MTLEHEKDGGRRRKSHQPIETSDSMTPKDEKNERSGKPELGLALRTVYQRTVEEEIPPEMLDLLGKLG